MVTIVEEPETLEVTTISELEEVLVKARQLIAQGWTKGARKDMAHDGTPLYCAVGAVEQACFGSTATSGPSRGLMATYIAALDLLNSVAPDELTIVDYNDHSSTTKQHILDKFMVARALARYRT